jgi:hypothetical protein
MFNAVLAAPGVLNKAGYVAKTKSVIFTTFFSG